MIINLQDFYAKKNDNLSIPDNEDIFIIDITECNDLWPVKKSENNIFYKFISSLPNLVTNKIIYISADCNVHERIAKWKKITGFDINFDVKIFPFDVMEPMWFQSFYDEIRINGKNTIKTKNFICLTCAPKLYRLLFLDEFYKNTKFDYSFYPYYHTEVLVKKNNQCFITPYKWNKDKNCIRTKRGFYHYLNDLVSVSDNNIFENGLIPIKNTRSLTEYDFIPNKKYDDLSLDDILEKSHDEVENDRYSFNVLFPKETFNANVDIVLESYIDDVVFFTEKIGKSIAFKRPYLALGGKNYNKFLEKMGFQLYDEIFDYTFDGLETIKDRYAAFVNEIKKFIDLEPIVFSEKLKALDSKIEFNYNLLKIKMEEKEIVHKIINGIIPTSEFIFLKKYDDIFKQ